MGRAGDCLVRCGLRVRISSSSISRWRTRRWWWRGGRRGTRCRMHGRALATTGAELFLGRDFPMWNESVAKTGSGQTQGNLKQVLLLVRLQAREIGATALPSVNWPSDHLSLYAEFLLTTADSSRNGGGGSSASGAGRKAGTAAGVAGGASGSALGRGRGGGGRGKKKKKESWKTRRGEVQPQERGDWGNRQGKKQAAPTAAAALPPPPAVTYSRGGGGGGGGAAAASSSAVSQLEAEDSGEDEALAGASDGDSTGDTQPPLPIPTKRDRLAGMRMLAEGVPPQQRERRRRPPQQSQQRVMVEELFAAAFAVGLAQHAAAAAASNPGGGR